MKEMVHHQKHYNKPGRKECIMEINERFGDAAAVYFALGSAYKNLYRDGAKDEHDQEICKAIWYVDYASDKIDSMRLVSDNMLTMYGYVAEELKRRIT